MTGRTTFFDTTRGIPQPINLAGVKITETLNGVIFAERLTPWEGHKSWEAMPDDAQRYLKTEWEENFKLLDPNLTTLSQAFR